MTFREDAIAALRAVQNADVGDANPYAGKSRAMAHLWHRGYTTMLTVRNAATRAMQRYRHGPGNAVA